jgi:hypothetical protein
MTPTTGGPSGGESSAPSAPGGAVIYYALADEANLEEDELTLEILDNGGEVLRTLKTDKEKGIKGGGDNASYAIPAQKGINRVVWDLRRNPTTSVDYKFLFGAARDDDAILGPTVAPGIYTVRLSVGDVAEETTVAVEWDPVNEYDSGRLAEQQAFAARTFNMLDDIFKRIDSLLDIKKQLELRKSLAEDVGDDALAEEASRLLDALIEWQESVTTPARENGQDVLNYAPKLDAFLINIFGQADSAVLGITQGQRDRLADIEPQWEAAMQAWDDLVSNEIAAFSGRAGPVLILPPWN